MPEAAMIGAVGNLMTSGINQANALYLTKEDRLENFKYNEKAAINADKRTRRLYRDFYSPEALLKQYNEAGLSPSLMFGGTPGQGGAQGAHGAGTSGPQTPFMPMSLVEAAQAAALFAQAEKTKKEANQVDPLAQSTIAKNLADAGHAEAAAAAAAAQAAGTKLDNYVKEHTLDASIWQICELAEQQAHATEKMYHEMRSAKVLADIDEETFEQQVQMRSAQLDLVLEQVETEKTKQKLNKQQVKTLKDQVLASIAETQLKWKALEVQEQQTQSYADWIEAQIPYIEKQLDVKLQELGIEKKKLVVNAITDIFKSIAIGAAAASQMGLVGKGNQTTPTTRPAPQYMQ